MLNTEEFIKRLEFIIAHFGMSASSFADKISVQRSSISHLLSGRNKPSLDFIMKVLDVFPELNLYWLLEGTGSYSKNESDEQYINKIQKATPPTPVINEREIENTISELKTATSRAESAALPSGAFSQKSSEKHIDKIVLFYTDGTFENYEPASSK